MCFSTSTGLHHGGKTTWQLITKPWQHNAESVHFNKTSTPQPPPLNITQKGKLSKNWACFHTCDQVWARFVTAIHFNGLRELSPTLFFQRHCTKLHDSATHWALADAWGCQFNNAWGRLLNGNAFLCMLCSLTCKSLNMCWNMVLPSTPQAAITA